VLACLGSLLGWQFTLSQTAKSAAEERMFPAFFAKVNAAGGADRWHGVHGGRPVRDGPVDDVAQPERAVLGPGQPGRRHQRDSVCDRALGPARDDAGGEGPDGKYRKNIAITLVATLYSVYALYASGKDAVLGGMLVLGIGYIIWGFIAPRFALRKPAAQGGAGLPPARWRPLAVAILTLGATTAFAGTLDQIRQAGRIRLGYRSDAAPLSFKDESGKPAGYSVALCQRIADAAKVELSMGDLPSSGFPSHREPLPSGPAGRGRRALRRRLRDAGQENRGRLLDPDIPGRHWSGLRADAPARLREILSGRPAEFRPLWRATRASSCRPRCSRSWAGTTSEKWLAGRLKDFQLTARVVPVGGYDAGIRGVLDGTSNVLFGDRAILLDAVKRSPSAGNLRPARPPLHL
jgi:putrescine:ornithine antiporter